MRYGIPAGVAVYLAGQPAASIAIVLKRKGHKEHDDPTDLVIFVIFVAFVAAAVGP